MVDVEQPLVRSLQRGLQIINLVAVSGPLHAKSVARRVELSLPTAYHLLRTLVHDGYLVRLDDGSYVLGGRLDWTGFATVPAVTRSLAAVNAGW
ncbi:MULTISPECIES: helix-turn-helix domain-containing protein [unclassified Mycolicibacterium]|uniref:helix-turn-helix domain-containing protein n=1 Tax=unclassified Mycolicibacterium TaxID=2636767 RepID=UPI001F4C343B|nr:helix-turn-helix domain-containing protein [Mycolicibacterium sp. YH-1]UNB51209.1 helix-turn-helix domain-containing protein [Mycolicibacterium sp. YH-1]HET7742451.1 helix-turn-helix domain-containing protein [Mycobacterium sp.]